MDGLVEKASGRSSEAVGVLCGEEAGCGSAGDAGFHVSVSTEVVGEAAGNVLALWDEVDVSGCVLTDFVD